MPGPQRQRRLDIALLISASRQPSATSLARALGVSPGTTSRWSSDGIPFFSADWACIALGLHPVEVWPDFHDESMTVAAA